MLLLSILISISPAKAAFASLVLPGSGDLMLGEKKRAALFMTTEATLWLSYFGLNWYKNEVHNSSSSYATLHASANVDGKDDRYFDALENFYSSDGYNEWVKEQARMLYPDTTDQEILERRREYIRANVYTGEDTWEWKTKEEADKYDDLRDSKREFATMATNVVGLAVANRVVNFFVTYLAGERVSVKLEKNKVEVGFRF